jgi:hypothetical protein
MDVRKDDSCKSLASSVLARCDARCLTREGLKRLWPFSCSRALARKALVSGLTVLLWLGLQILAVSPHLHHEIHHDSHQPEHQCAVKVLSEGQVDIASGPIVVAVPSPTFAPRLLAESVLLIAADHQLPPGRAPPVSLT